MIVAEFGLRGAGGEPVSFERTVHSHGLAALAPATIRPATAALPLAYHRTLSAAGRIVEATLRERSGRLVVETRQQIGKKAAAEVAGAARRMFRLDDDLAPFYRRIASDARLSWAAAGAGRILASPTVFEDVVKTLCTTNCAWSGTVRMTQALASLGGGAFPDAGAIGSAPASWFRDVAAAHIMMLLGRNRRLVLDSWTRPSYLRLAKKKRARDSSIERAFAPYGEYAGLAFWLFLTRDWVGDDA